MYVINSDFKEETNTLFYLGCTIPYQNDKNITVKLSKFLHTTRITNETLQNFKFQKLTGIKIYIKLWHY
jgi:hypothetical protein